MHPITAKLIALERSEACVTSGWPKGAQLRLREQAKLLRRDLPPHILSVFDRFKTETKGAVVRVFGSRCDGCHVGLSKATLARLKQGNELSRCGRCGRFIYVFESLVSHGHHPVAKRTKYAA
jgi:predicted  nucleic acid-binding Zn-ribbon protein